MSKALNQSYFCAVSVVVQQCCCVDAVDSVAQTFNNCLTSMSDFKELIPEFYESNGEFLQNIHRINFGTRQDGHTVNDVELPPWAKSM